MKKGIDYIGVGSGAIIINREGKFFLAKRGNDCRNEIGKWDFPGGSIEFGERVEDGIVREIKEEHDFDIEVMELLEVCNHIIPEEKQHWVSPTFLCRVKNGEPKICEPDKCDEIGWFSLGEIEKLNLSSSSAQNFKTINERFGKEGVPNYYKNNS